MNTNPKVKDVLYVLGITGFVAASILLPGLPNALSPLLKKQTKFWGHFNPYRLRAELKRLRKIGIIEEINEEEAFVFRLTEKGKAKLFRYKMEDLKLNTKSWDGKWRLVAYDIPKVKKNQADAFRYLLKKMDFYQLQKSLWLTPYPCANEIEFLKSFYHLGERVTVLTILGLEGESAYKDYFGVQ